MNRRAKTYFPCVPVYLSVATLPPPFPFSCSSRLLLQRERERERERKRERLDFLLQRALIFLIPLYVFILSSPTPPPPPLHVLFIITVAALSRLIFNPRWFSNIRGTKISKFPARTYPAFAFFLSFILSFFFFFLRPVKITTSTRVPVKNTHIEGEIKTEGTCKGEKRCVIFLLRGNDEEVTRLKVSWDSYCREMARLSKRRYLNYFV